MTNDDMPKQIAEKLNERQRRIIGHPEWPNDDSQPIWMSHQYDDWPASAASTFPSLAKLGLLAEKPKERSYVYGGSNRRRYKMTQLGRAVRAIVGPGVQAEIEAAREARRKACDAKIAAAADRTRASAVSMVIKALKEGKLSARQIDELQSAINDSEEER